MCIYIYTYPFWFNLKLDCNMFKPSTKTSWVRCDVLPAPFSHCGSSRCSPNLNRPNRNVHCNQISRWGIQVCTYIYTYIYIYIYVYCIHNYYIHVYYCIFIVSLHWKDYMVNMVLYRDSWFKSFHNFAVEDTRYYGAGETMTTSVISENFCEAQNTSLKGSRSISQTLQRGLNQTIPIYIYIYIHTYIYSYIYIYIHICIFTVYTYTQYLKNYQHQHRCKYWSTMTRLPRGCNSFARVLKINGALRFQFIHPHD